MKIRALSIAGSFYPTDVNELAATVVGLLDFISKAVLHAVSA
jgi:predicted class III extradiol MEMO1 family dioxygenase